MNKIIKQLVAEAYAVGRFNDSDLPANVDIAIASLNYAGGFLQQKNITCFLEWNDYTSKDDLPEGIPLLVELEKDKPPFESKSDIMNYHVAYKFRTSNSYIVKVGHYFAGDLNPIKRWARFL